MMLDRYQITEIIGQGDHGGLSFRAFDRLDQAEVALKQIRLESPELHSISDSFSTYTSSLKFALAQEFQTLATLRHPYIISVLDYGFDYKHNPFYSMEYLGEARTVLEVGKEKTNSEKLILLQQMLEALAYLHRRKIIHGDIKPSNVLVDDGDIKLLDFGLSTSIDSNIKGYGGSLYYVAPEILASQASASPQTDLYAVGVIAYQLFANAHPFDLFSENFISEVIHQPIDYEKLGVDDSLREFVYRLMARPTNERFKSAREALGKLTSIINLPTHSNRTTIRESYLQAAKFVGRDREIRLLQISLKQALLGRESAWLIGGESGVGKSRLIREIETEALVEGMVVLRGRGIKGESEGPYQIWIEPLRYLLVISSQVDDLTASVLLPLVPDIGNLLQRKVEPAPDIDEKSAALRLFRTIGKLFRQQKRPILLILEDLQWAHDSWEILPFLIRQVSGMPVMILGSYRNDENPDIPNLLKEMKLIQLERLDQEAVGELAISMIGDVAKQSGLIERLQIEAEGNTFFLIEIVRMLAEQAGGLGNIQIGDLNQSILPEGILSIVQQRMDRVPSESQSLLQMAAVAGRIVDPKLLAYFSSSMDVGRLLVEGSESAIFEIQNGSWQFTHDKIREGIQLLMPESDLSSAHFKLANANEEIYGDERASTIYYHWNQTDEVEKIREYGVLAAKRSYQTFAYQEAASVLVKTIRLTTNLMDKFELMLLREECLNAIGNREEQAIEIEQLFELAKTLEDPNCLVMASLRRSEFKQRIGDHQTAESDALQVILLGGQHQNLGWLANGYLAQGATHLSQGDTARAVRSFEQAAHYCRSIDSSIFLIRALLELGNGYFRQGNYNQAEQQIKEAIELSEQDESLIQFKARGLDRLAEIEIHLGRHDEARAHLNNAIEISKSLGLRLLEGEFTRTLSLTYFWQQNYDSAIQHSKIAHEIFQEMGDLQNNSRVLNQLGLIEQLLGNHFKAKEYFQKTIAAAGEIDYVWSLESSHSNLGASLVQMGSFKEAFVHINQALEYNIVSQNAQARGFSLFGLGKLRLMQGNYPMAKRHLEEALEHLKDVPSPMVEAFTRMYYGETLLAQNNWEEAEKQLMLSREIASEINHVGIKAEGCAYLAFLLASQKRNDFAKTSIDEFELFQAKRPMLSSIICQGRVWYAIIQAAELLDDSRITKFKAYARKWFERRKTEIEDPKYVDLFSNNVPTHRELLKLIQLS